MSGILLDIPALTCAYRSGQTVFSLRELRFHRGELVFLLGRSGVGKSTFLELAGLMNLPPGGTEGELIFHPPNGPQVPLIPLWLGDGTRLAEFRSRHFSFIFQDTNFLDHFTAAENMMLPALVQGMSEQRIQGRVQALMQELDLPLTLQERFPAYVSGGQRQRMAFIRALAGDFDILFGDEPTGNLDADTAARLLTVLRDHLHAESRSGLIVSHDIGLAVRFADRILVLTEEDTAHSGSTILPEHRFRRDGEVWVREDGSTLESSLAEHLGRIIRSQPTQASHP